VKRKRSIQEQILAQIRIPPVGRITREQAQDMVDAHAEGLHTPPEGVPREGCPECEDRPLRSYPPAKDVER
jgi:hypothetical protein